MLLLLSGEGDDVERRLSSGCKRLEWEKRLTVFFRPLDGAAAARATGRHAARRSSASSPASTRRASWRAWRARIADHGANITDLHSDLRPEPESGTPIYTMRLRLVVPPGQRRARRCAQALERRGGRAARRPERREECLGSAWSYGQAIGDGARRPAAVKTAGGASGASRQASASVVVRESGRKRLDDDRRRAASVRRPRVKSSSRLIFTRLVIESR